MGAFTFDTYSEGRDAPAAFRRAVDDAVAEHGDGGYSGTIAEKTTYVIITLQPMSPDDATTMANTLLDNDDPRIADKWGPAGAIPVIQPTRTVCLDALTDLPGTPASDHELASLTRIARERHLITGAETITGGHRTRDGYLATVAKHPARPAVQSEPDGWLFFGWASS